MFFLSIRFFKNVGSHLTYTRYIIYQSEISNDFIDTRFHIPNSNILISSFFNLCLMKILLHVIAGTGVSEGEKYQILEAHNRLRSSVALGQVASQPSAQNMQEMVWDDDLAARAQQWAEQCHFDHDPSRYTGMFIDETYELIDIYIYVYSSTRSFYNGTKFGHHLEYHSIGWQWRWFPIAHPKLVQRSQQICMGLILVTSYWSLFTSMYSTYDNSFSEEKKKLKLIKSNHSFIHQLVWGETNLVGCGFSYYYSGSRYNKLYVCNYGPG